MKQSSGQAWELETKQVSRSLRLLTLWAQGKAQLFTHILILGAVVVADELRLWLQGVASDLILIFYSYILYIFKAESCT